MQRLILAMALLVIGCGTTTGGGGTSVTGAAGGVLLRPFARLISKAGDSVTTYGEPWNMN